MDWKGDCGIDRGTAMKAVRTANRELGSVGISALEGWLWFRAIASLLIPLPAQAAELRLFLAVVPVRHGFGISLSAEEGPE